MTEKNKNKPVELHLDEAQINKLQNMLDDKKSNFFTSSVSKVAGYFANFFSLKNSGKWVSVATIAVVLNMMMTFLATQHYSMEAMQLIVPYISQIAITVFGIIGGVKGAKGLIDKFNQKN